MYSLDLSPAIGSPQSLQRQVGEYHVTSRGAGEMDARPPGSAPEVKEELPRSQAQPPRESIRLLTSRVAGRPIIRSEHAALDATHHRLVDDAVVGVELVN